MKTFKNILLTILTLGLIGLLIIVGSITGFVAWVF